MVDDFSEIIVCAVSAERPRKESLALRLAGVDWVCYCGDELCWFVAQRVGILVAIEASVLPQTQCASGLI
jgi:hypothetical protein